MVVTVDLKLKMKLFILLELSSLLLLVGAQNAPGPGVGANWGMQASHPLPPDTVVRLLKDNGIRRVKLFDAEYDALRALGGSGIDVMVGIPNEMLFSLATSMKAAEKWVSQNVSKHLTNDGASITYVAVGNEPFLSTYNGSFLNTTFPALRNIQAALIKAGLQQKVKATCPMNADVYESSTTFPSGGDFRADIHDLMIAIVKFLADSNSAFTVNIYPFLSLYLNADFPVEYAFFDGNATPLNDGGTSYYNMFDANYDTLVHALQKNGFGSMPIIVGEIGWPTDGDRNANAQYAQRFNQGFMQRIVSGKGTPMRPDPINAYLFSLIDEDAKSVQPGNFERHWGIFTYDGLPKYNLNLGIANSGNLVQAKGVSYQERKWCVMRTSSSLDDPSIPPSVSYACGLADCSSLGYGTSCGGLDARGNISFAFNSYYQIHDQLEGACRFNVSTITKTDPSTPSCRFPVMIQPYYGGAEQLVGCYKQRLSLVAALMLFLLTIV